ncbi:ComE operon protein 1 [bacterium HR10]|nr:ComE operon protein 1 [bacterium HR10]
MRRALRSAWSVIVIIARRARRKIGETEWRESLARGLKGASAVGLIVMLAFTLARFRKWREERAIREQRTFIERVCSPGKANLNRATPVELQAIRGIGPVLAQEIVRYRERHGPFHRVEELLVLRGVGPRKLKALEAFLCVEPE